ncbi:Proteasome lid subunit RPN8/RPN11, contains Jab1/MPN metalloenzyme (JAMM) motif [Methanobrevibacter gottschalkii]|uniref:Proteasome lid subunit RPN8/RPN11 n=2 Tax=Methanobrevibacter gottschalkii TaxID=190974 RepID=A0A3N5AZY2_9EURY|nr:MULTISPECIES: Mov34/MPN/PAD-1 family protein [Methanobrevibacter]MCQ2970540.1 Mov34/MPN/PAD-1 family protein [archaeon]OED00518.1 peptidase [Methanobrevibacter sp. A27]RPF50479.1 proteasome lid subunit RPN8/RPN11 [Methanobrevibacter gottschalkii DSM 11977]SEK87381.1 Proteasome lid subunit RPN8/RPN11, contains Jab1/MPN metalloenzyme (JAMM) motif [Methanobrevibacter gottschalkii]
MSFISKLFGNNDDEFEEVRVDREVLNSVIYYSKQAYPNEFLAFLDGKIKNRILYITGLIFIPGETCETGAVIHSEMVPMNTKYFGSVHSHPGPSASPSDADLMTFSKNGYFHMIVCLPYSYNTFKAYDRHGESIDYIVGDYAYLVNDDLDEFFDEDDVLTDNDEFKPGFFDEDDDEFFKNLDEEKVNHYDEFEKRNQINNQLPNNVIKIELNNDGNVKKISRRFKD